ncbi:hypothetical protein SAMN04489760_1273 [Syntrophus gentianae]|uniref:Uncharacterized protein n=1 Tax=Syntrophus gentianae TaxID=43775 RepID=A0A1H7ZTB5_9BACT|nr:hypothetical protein SAMN04489760_1273 [Syntrophus gentianae]
MNDPCKEKIMCLSHCPRCDRPLKVKDERILSVYDHEPICMRCKSEEEKRHDYGEILQKMFWHCMINVQMAQGDPGRYYYNHFYTYKCQ